MFGLENSANNFGRSAGLLANTTALRPVEAAEGTIYVDVQTLLIYRYDAIITNSWQQIGGGGVTGAFNGCQEQSSQIGLGGTLIEATQIETTDYPIEFFAGATDTAQFKVITNAAISELAYFTSTNSFNDGGVYIGNFEAFGTIQSKSYAGQAPTELRLNYDGGTIQLGNSGFGMRLDDGTPLIGTTYNNTSDGLLLNFDARSYLLGDFDFAAGGNYLGVYDADNYIVTYSGNSEKGLKLDFANNVYSFGDFFGTVNETFLQIDDQNRIIYTSFIDGAIGIRLNYANKLYQLGDFDVIDNQTLLQVDDNAQAIYFATNIGKYNFTNVPNYAGNAAAILAGLNVGDIYRSSTGGGDQLHIVH